MKIKVEENLFIESDGMQFLLKQYSGKVDKDNRETYKTLGYFGTVNALLKSLLQKKILNSNVTTIKELLERVKQIEKELDELIKI